MTRLFILVFYCLVIIAAEAQSCSPTFKEIFDFGVGDEFYYSADERDGICPVRPCSSWHRKEKKKILSRNVIGDTLKYVVDHFKYTYTYYPRAPYPYDRQGSSSRFIDTLIYVDSLNNVWNKCYTDTVRTFDNLYGTYIENRRYSLDRLLDFSPIFELTQPF